MLDYETLKAELIEKQSYLLAENAALQQIRRICKPLDGKMYNVRIARAIEEQSQGKIHATSSSDRFNCWIYDSKHRIQDVLWMKPSYTKIIKNKRLDYSELEKIIINNIQHNRKEMADIESDIANAETILSELETLKAYYTSLCNKLSKETRSRHSRDLSLSVHSY